MTIEQLVFPFWWQIEPVERVIVSVPDDWPVWAWLKTDDKLPRFPAMRALSVEARWLLIVLLSHCAEYETYGLIEKKDLAMLLAAADLKQPKKAFDNLLKDGAVVTDPDGYYVPLYLEMNPTRERVQRQRENTRKRVSDWRKRNRVTNVVTDPVSNDILLDGTGLHGTVVPLQEVQQREVDTEERPEVQAAKQWSRDRLRNKSSESR